MPITFVSASEGKQPKSSATASPHPLDPLSPDEITKVHISRLLSTHSYILTFEQAAGIAKDAFPGKVLNFRFITLKEPLKRLLTPYLNAEHASHASQGLTNLRPPREARVQVISPSNTQKKKPELHELIVDIEKNEVVKTEYLEGKHSYIDAAYMQDVERACMADERVKEEVKKLKLPEGATVVVEPWAYATDGMCDTSERTTMVSLTRDPWQ
jgi:primary-amine oxidase